MRVCLPAARFEAFNNLASQLHTSRTFDLMAVCNRVANLQQAIT
jgi:hypothetical protein